MSDQLQHVNRPTHFRHSRRFGSICRFGSVSLSLYAYTVKCTVVL